MPIRLRCDCGKVLNVPDRYAGRRVECPGCKKPLTVPGGSESDQLDVMPIEDFETGVKDSMPTRRPASARARPRARRRSRKRERRTKRPPPPVAEPSPQAAGRGEERCPGCKALLMRGAIICTVCGLDLTTGKHFAGVRTKLFQIRALLGPVAAVGMVAALVYLWKGGYIKEWISKPPTETEEPPAKPVLAPRRPDAPAPEEKPEALTPAAGEYAGGAVEGELSLSDATHPYIISAAIVVKAGAKLKVGSGVVLRGTSVGALELAGGELSVKGEEGARVRVELPVSSGQGGAQGIRLECADFSSPVVLKGAGPLKARRCSFSAPMECDPRDTGGKVEVLFEECAFFGSVNVRAGFVADRLKISFWNCTFYGKVSCEGDAFAEVNLSGCYWGPESGVERASKGLTVKLEPKLKEPPAGVPRPEEKPATVLAEDMILNRAGGYSFLCPSGWKPIGRRGLRGPYSLGSPRLEILVASEEAAELRKKAIAGIRKASPVGLIEGEVESVRLPAGEAQTFELRYSSLGRQYVKKYYVLRGPKGKVVLVWTYRSEMEEKLARTRGEITSSFGFLGGE